MAHHMSKHPDAIHAPRDRPRQRPRVRRIGLALALPILGLASCRALGGQASEPGGPQGLLNAVTASPFVFVALLSTDYVRHGREVGAKPAFVVVSGKRAPAFQPADLEGVRSLMEERDTLGAGRAKR